MSDVCSEINLNFLYKACNCHGFAMSQCLEVPEVRRRLCEVIRHGGIVDAKVFVEVLTDVYQEFDADRKAHKDFHFRNARTVIKKVSDHLNCLNT